jgi:AcrR family transcriptional regulator
MTRRYQLRKRAESRDATRRRIVEAAVALHESLGPNATTVTAIAEAAGVGRLTVYRHFPDDRSLLSACSGHWLGRHPPPDPAAWERVVDPLERLTRALTEVYAYFGEAKAMLAQVEQDAPGNPAVAEAATPLVEAWARMRDVVAAAWEDDTSESSALRPAAIGHALAFSTWWSLTREQSLNDEQAIALMLATVRCVR